MSDLSKVLGDLYDGGGEPAPRPANDYRATAPAWADEDRLDEAFAEWTPGPPDDAPAAEREMSVVLDMPAVPPARLDEDMAATLSAALAEAATAPPAPAWDASPILPEPDPAAEAWEPMPVSSGRVWQRTDDDIFPGTSGGVRKERKVKAPRAASTALRLPKLGKAAKDAKLEAA